MDLQLVPLDAPTETREFTKGRFELYRVGGMTLGRASYEPGWKWSEHVGAAAGERWCEVEHVGLVLSGRAMAAMRDGTERVMEPGQFFYVPPGHDSWVVGDEPYVSLHIMGSEDYAVSEPTGGAAGQLDLADYKVLSFDCYGTLIDWEAGIAAVLAPWAREQGLDLGDEDLLLAYADHEAAVERETPSALYPEVLAMAFRRVGEQLEAPVSDAWAQRLGESVPDWPAFPDSADALARLARRYRLIILSNVHRAGFAGSNRQLRGEFAAIITAEDVGAYKPAENHFRALEAALPGLGLDRGDLLHVAQSLFHDHVPAKRKGWPSVWIDRRHGRPGWGATPEPAEAWSYGLKFDSMAGFADAVDRAFTARG